MFTVRPIVTVTESTPRFVVMASVMQFGNRDEYIGTTEHVIGAAYSAGWANRIAVQHGADDGDNYEYQVWVKDTRPELMPVVEPDAAFDAITAWDDLPF